MQNYGFVAEIHESGAHGGVDWKKRLKSWSIIESDALRIAVNPFQSTEESLEEVQPIDNPNEVLVYQGRCDNREEIALYLKNQSLTNRLDGEFFLGAYRKWGEFLGEKVLGEYSLMVYDKQRRKATAVRSTFSGPPIFFLNTSQSFFVASDLSAMLRVLLKKPEIDEGYISEYFLDAGIVRTERTPYKSVRRLLPGHVLIYSRGNFNISKYYSIDRISDIRYKIASEYEEQFRFLIRNAVRNTLRSSGNILIDLSGGLDSSTIVSVASELCKNEKATNHKISTISYIHSESPISNEVKYQNAVASVSPFETHLFDIDKFPPFTGLPEGQYWEPDPLVGHPAFENLLCKWMVDKKIKIVIKGLAGDEVLSGLYGSPIHLASYLRNWRFGKWGNELLNWYRVHEEYNLLGLIWKHSFRPLVFPKDILPHSGTEIPNWFKSDYKEKRLRFADKERLHKNTLHIKNPAKRFHAEMLKRIESYHSHQLSTAKERLPMVYRPLVEFMYAIPWDKKISAKWDRLLQRRALRGILPEEVRTRRTKTGNEQSMLRGLRIGANWINGIIDSLNITERGYVNKEKFKSAVEKLRHGVIGDDRPYIIAALNLEMWFRKHPFN